MDITTRVVIMPDAHWMALARESARLGLSIDQAIVEAVTLYLSSDPMTKAVIQEGVSIAPSNEELAKMMREVTAAELQAFSRVIPQPIDPGYWQERNVQKDFEPRYSPHAIFKQVTEGPKA